MLKRHDDDSAKNGYRNNIDIRFIQSYISSVMSAKPTIRSSKQTVMIALLCFVITANFFRVILLNRNLTASFIELPVLPMINDRNQLFENITATMTNENIILNTTTSVTSSSWSFDKIDSFWNESLHSKQKNLPHLVIHVGPPKTASTTIQQYLTQWSYERILQKYDQYVYIGRFVSGKGKMPAGARKLNNLQLALYNLDCHAMMSTIRQEYYEEKNKQEELQQIFINMTLSEAILSKLSCARSIIAYLKPYAQSRTNLLYVEEGLSVRDMKNYGKANDTRYRQLYGPNSYLTVFDWESLHAILYDYYQITVMMTYRRYYDWLPSVKQQIERWMARKPVMNRWPKYDDPINVTDILISKIMIANHTVTNISYLRSNIIENSRVVEATDFKGRNIVPIFPNWWKTNLPPGTTADLHAYYLDLIIPGIDQVNHHHESTLLNDASKTSRLLTSSSLPLIRLAIMNMHGTLPPLPGEDYNATTESSSSTIRSLFFCALPAATNLCRYSQELDQEAARSGNKSEVRKNEKQSTWYDEIVINAARYGFINITKYVTLRHIIGSMVKRYHTSKIKKYKERLLLLSNSTSSTSLMYGSNTTRHNDSLNVGFSVYEIDNYEFPLLCPSFDELTEFLNQSLLYEEQIVPDFYHNEKYGKNEHIRRFWDAVHNKNKESYCSIDIVSILQQSHWQHFFINMLPWQLRRMNKTFVV